MIVAGQVHGGLAQGIGQALLEGCVYDKETGQLLTGSYNDYAMPRADDLPSFGLSTHVTLCTHNPLGVKGCGEAGAIGAPAAIANAIVDALKPLGVKHVEMPATPERLWRTIQQHHVQAGQFVADFVQSAFGLGEFFLDLVAALALGPGEVAALAVEACLFGFQPLESVLAV